MSTSLARLAGKRRPTAAHVNRVASGTIALTLVLLVAVFVFGRGPGSLVWLTGQAPDWLPLAGSGLSWMPFTHPQPSPNNPQPVAPEPVAVARPTPEPTPTATPAPTPTATPPPPTPTPTPVLRVRRRCPRPRPPLRPRRPRGPARPRSSWTTSRATRSGPRLRPPGRSAGAPGTCSATRPRCPPPRKPRRSRPGPSTPGLPALRPGPTTRSQPPSRRRPPASPRSWPATRIPATCTRAVSRMAARCSWASSTAGPGTHSRPPATATTRPPGTPSA